MSQGHILIIADVPAVAASLTQSLESQGLTAMVLSPGELLQSRHACRFDLAVIALVSLAQTQQALADLKLWVCPEGAPCVVEASDTDASRSAEIVEIIADGAGDGLNGLNELLREHQHRVEQKVCCSVRFRIPSNCKFIDAVNEKLNVLYAQLRLDRETIHRLTMAVREMVHNAIEWGNRDHPDMPVIARCEIDSQNITISVRDNGKGFNPQILPHAATTTDPTAHLHVRDELGLRAGGFGILMTRGLVDELHYNEEGNEVRIVKRLPQSA